MFGKTEFRLNRMEQCCEKLTKIAEDAAKYEQKMADTQEAIVKDLKAHARAEDNKLLVLKEDLKSVQDDMNTVTMRMYFVIGGAAVLLSLLNYMDLGIAISQGGK